MYALGILLQEDVTYNAKQPEFNITRNYRIPSAACIRREMIIRMLNVCAPLLCHSYCIIQHDVIKPKSARRF